MKKGDKISFHDTARVTASNVSSAAPCLGYRNLISDSDGCVPTVPGFDLPLNTEVDIQIVVTITKMGRDPKVCQNPWPSHKCDGTVAPRRKRS